MKSINQSGENENLHFILENTSKLHGINAYVINLSGNYFNSNLAFGSSTNMCWDDAVEPS